MQCHHSGPQTPSKMVGSRQRIVKNPGLQVIDSAFLGGTTRFRRRVSEVAFHAECLVPRVPEGWISDCASDPSAEGSDQLVPVQPTHAQTGNPGIGPCGMVGGPPAPRLLGGGAAGAPPPLHHVGDGAGQPALALALQPQQVLGLVLLQLLLRLLHLHQQAGQF